MSRVGILALSLVTQFLLADFLEPAGRGSYHVCIVYANLLAIMFMPGFEMGCRYFVASKKMSVSEGVTNLILLGLAFSALAVGIGAALTQVPLGFLQQFFSKAAPRDIAFAILLVPLVFFSMQIPLMLTSVRDFKWFALGQCFQTLAQLIGVVVFVSVFRHGVTGALAAIAIGHAVAILLSLAILARKHGFRPVKPAMAGIRSAFSYGWRYYFGKLSTLVNVQIGTILLAMLATTRAEMGLFAVGMVLVRITMIPDTLVIVVLPRVAADASGRPDLVACCARLSSILAAAVLLLVAIVVKPAFAAFLPKYNEAVVLIWLIAPGVAVWCAAKVLIPYFNGTNRPGISSLAVAAGVTTNLVLLLLLLPRMGLPGAALAVSMGYLVSSALLVISFFRLSGMSLAKTWIPGQLDREMVGGAWKSVRARLGLQPAAQVNADEQPPRTPEV